MIFYQCQEAFFERLHSVTTLSCNRRDCRSGIARTDGTGYDLPVDPNTVLQRTVEVDWNEIRRLANLPEYRNFPECDALVQVVADELERRNPLHPD
jgi:hypothetical protein